MNSLHPHWHSTGDEDSSSQSPERTEASTPTHIEIVPASRLPAALVGIAVATIIGITAIGAWKPLLAQVSGSGQGSGTASTNSQASSLAAVEVHITKDGFSPAIITVKPGQKITWINDHTVPYILTSQTLRNQSGSYLNTPAIFPKGRGSFTVGTREADKEHAYGSSTDKKLVGTVVVSKSGQVAEANDPCQEASGGPGIFGGLDDINLPTGRGVSSNCPPRSSASSKAKIAASSAPAVVAVAPVSSSAPAVTATSISSSSAAASLAAAPVVADGTTLDSLGGNPAYGAAPLTGQVSNTIIDNNSYAPAAPEPVSQPDTGPAGVYVIAIMSIAVLAVMMRKHFQTLA